MNPYMQYKLDSGITARWHGGEYIEFGEVDPHSGDWFAYDIINVWNYAKGEPRIPRTLAAFKVAVDERLAMDES